MLLVYLRSLNAKFCVIHLFLFCENLSGLYVVFRVTILKIIIHSVLTTVIQLFGSEIFIFS